MLSYSTVRCILSFLVSCNVYLFDIPRPPVLFSIDYALCVNKIVFNPFPAKEFVSPVVQVSQKTSPEERKNNL